MQEKAEFISYKKTHHTFFFVQPAPTQLAAACVEKENSKQKKNLAELFSDILRNEVSKTLTECFRLL